MQARVPQVSWMPHHWCRCWYGDAVQHAAHHTHWEYRSQPLLLLPLACLSGCSCEYDGCCGGCYRPAPAPHSKAGCCCLRLQQPAQLRHCEGCRQHQQQQQWAWKTLTGWLLPHRHTERCWQCHLPACQTLVICPVGCRPGPSCCQTAAGCQIAAEPLRARRLTRCPAHCHQHTHRLQMRWQQLMLRRSLQLMS
jgi:hypothetical protein